jgi:hypothetical protein
MIKPGKYACTRIKPLSLANSHDRYIAVTRTETCVRWGMVVTYNRYKFVTVSLLKPKGLRNDRFTSENTFQWFQK